MKSILLKEFEEKWGDDLKVVLHEQDVRELFSDISKLMRGISIRVSKNWEAEASSKYLFKKVKNIPEKIPPETMIEL